MSSLPQPKITIREISDSTPMLEILQAWHARRPGFTAEDEAFYQNAIGSDWRHFMFWVDHKPTVCFSIQQLGEHCYEVHTAAEIGASPHLVRQFALDCGSYMMGNPQCRLVSKCPADHRAAVWLNKRFLNLESEQTVDGRKWLTFGSSAQEWDQRHG